MKKIIILISTIIFPLNVFAYSNYIIPGGNTLGININTDGIIIVGLYKVNNKDINTFLKSGDRIIKIEEENIYSSNDLVNLIDKYKKDDKVNITYISNKKEYQGTLSLIYDNDVYKTGLYIKNRVEGVGTLTYIDPETGIYGALGHIINDSKTNTKIEIKDGETYLAEVSNITRSTNGNPGSKDALYKKEDLFGTINKNTNYGIFGTTKEKINNQSLEIASLDNTNLGEAFIYTTDLNNKIKKYKIKILEIDKHSKEKNFFFEITDEELLKETGGIVQGMSGSPIIQNDKIIGAVTRVLVSDVKKGYGISIITMLEEGEK